MNQKPQRSKSFVYLVPDSDQMKMKIGKTWRTVTKRLNEQNAYKFSEDYRIRIEVVGPHACRLENALMTYFDDFRIPPVESSADVSRKTDWFQIEALTYLLQFLELYGSNFAVRDYEIRGTLIDQQVYGPDTSMARFLPGFSRSAQRRDAYCAKQLLAALVELNAISRMISVGAAPGPNGEIQFFAHPIRNSVILARYESALKEIVVSAHCRTASQSLLLNVFRDEARRAVCIRFQIPLDPKGPLRHGIVEHLFAQPITFLRDLSGVHTKHATSTLRRLLRPPN